MRETMMKKYECPQTKWMTVETAGIMAASREGGVVNGTLSKENNCSWIEDDETETDNARSSSVWEE